jgi:hypothetical protein
MKAKKSCTFTALNIYSVFALLLIGVTIIFSSCGKGSDPVPVTPPVVVTPPPSDNGNGTGTGSTNKGYVFENIFSLGYGVYLDNDNDKVTQLLFQFTDRTNKKYSTKTGNIKIIPKNIVVADNPYSFPDPYSEFIQLKNILPREYKPEDVDSTKAVFKVIDPKNKDKEGRQIIELIYLWNLGVIGNDGMNVNGGKKLNGQPIPVDVIVKKVTTSTYTLL